MFAGLIDALPGLEGVILDKIIHLPSPSSTIDPPGPLVPAVTPKTLRYLYILETRIEETDLLSALSTLCEFLRPVSSVAYLQFRKMHSSCDLENLEDVRGICKTLEHPTDFKVELLEFYNRLAHRFAILGAHPQGISTQSSGARLLIVRRE